MTAERTSESRPAAAFASPPDVDVVIPTLNCVSALDRTLSGLRAQKYGGAVRLMVVDAGSTDGTLELARSAGATVFVNPGQYGTGLSGGRHFGETHGTSPLVWVVDSDNYLTGDRTLERLVRPFLDDPAIQLSVPFLDLNSLPRSFNRWLSLVEQSALDRERRRGIARNGWVLVDPIEHGVSNCSLLRRTALESAGGYDSDLRLMMRLRRLGLARAALVPDARFVHDQAVSAAHFARKASARIRRFGRMSDAELRAFFVEYPVPLPLQSELQKDLRRGTALAPIQSLEHLLDGGERTWAWGIVYPLLIGGVILRHPRASWNVYRRFL